MWYPQSVRCRHDLLSGVFTPPEGTDASFTTPHNAFSTTDWSLRWSKKPNPLLSVFSSFSDGTQALWYVSLFLNTEITQPVFTTIGCTFASKQSNWRQKSPIFWHRKDTLLFQCVCILVRTNGPPVCQSPENCFEDEDCVVQSSFAVQLIPTQATSVNYSAAEPFLAACTFSRPKYKRLAPMQHKPNIKITDESATHFPSIAINDRLGKPAPGQRTLFLVRAETRNQKSFAGTWNNQLQSFSWQQRTYSYAATPNIQHGRKASHDNEIKRLIVSYFQEAITFCGQETIRFCFVVQFWCSTQWSDLIFLFAAGISQSLQCPSVKENRSTPVTMTQGFGRITCPLLFYLSLVTHRTLDAPRQIWVTRKTERDTIPRHTTIWRFWKLRRWKCINFVLSQKRIVLLSTMA